MNERDSMQAQRQIYQRLAQLDEETQERISQKYYHGTRPWLKTKESPVRRRRGRGEPAQRQEE